LGALVALAVEKAWESRPARIWRERKCPQEHVLITDSRKLRGGNWRCFNQEEKDFLVSTLDLESTPGGKLSFEVTP